MAKQIQLTIPKPCHENWDAMNDVEKGKFCGSCQKQVVDFTNMSDRQLAEFFKKPSTGSVCGRFMTDQLERDIEVPKKRMPWLKYFFTIAIPAFFASKVMAQEKPKIIGKIAYRPVKDTIKLATVSPVRMLGEVSSTILPFEKKDTIVPTNPLQCGKIENAVTIGKIVGETGVPVPGALISFTNRGNTIVADNKGEFVFPDSWLKDGELITFSSVGYINKIVAASAIKKERNIVKLSAESVIIEEPITDTVFSYPHITMGIIAYVEPDNKKVQTPEKDEKKTTKKNVKDPLSIQVFPNPVESGNTFNFKMPGSKEGYYQLQLLSITGQAVYEKEIWVDASAKLFNIVLPKLASGVYTLQLVHKTTGEKSAEQIVIQ